MNFKEVLLGAKAGDEQCICTLLEMYHPFLIKSAIIQGIYDEDLYQEICVTLLKCIRQFNL